MTELDLDQKLEMRRAFWAMGGSTRIDVKLSALVPRAGTKSRSGAEEWTDLDVIGVFFTPASGLSFSVADCKTLKGRVTERVFWLRGVADLFGAQSAFLTRDDPAPGASRQLALRLGLTLLDANDRRLLLEHVGDERLPAAGDLLKRETLLRWVQLTSGGGRKLERLQRYRRAGYWVAPRHRNLTFLPSIVSEVRDQFLPHDRAALALVSDLTWLYVAALLAALDDVVRLHLSDLRTALQQMVVGGEQALRERELLAERLRVIIAALPPSSEARPEVEVLPPYFDALLDLAQRLLRQRSAMSDVLRVLEFVGVETIAGRGARWSEAFPNASPLPAKLASDAVRFVVRASGLASGFVQAFNAALTTAASTSVPQPPEPGLFPASDLGGPQSAASQEEPISKSPKHEKLAKVGGTE